MGEYEKKQDVTVKSEPLLRALACAVGGVKAIYVSGPITTGRRFLDWLGENGDAVWDPETRAAKLRLEVVTPNEKRIWLVAEKTREATGRVVIEPASLLVPEWGQPEYLNFWLQVIARFATEVIVVSGWQYSVGCVAEFHHAVRLGRPVLDERGLAIGEAQGRAMINEALSELEALGRGSRSVANIVKGLRAHDL